MKKMHYKRVFRKEKNIRQSKTWPMARWDQYHSPICASTLTLEKFMNVCYCYYIVQRVSANTLASLRFKKAQVLYACVHMYFATRKKRKGCLFIHSLRDHCKNTIFIK